MGTSTMSYEWFTAPGRALSSDERRVETAAGWCDFIGYVNGKDAYGGVIVGRDFYSLEFDEPSYA